jgi:hypothetical protein
MMSGRTLAIARGVGVIGSTIAVVVGVTLAATGLTSNDVTLSANSISSATAALQIKSGGSFGISDTGFTFSDVVPGGPAQPLAGNAFQLKNNGTVDLAVTVKVPSAVNCTASIDKSKVHVIINRTSGSNPQLGATDTLADLETGVALTDNLAAGVTASYKMQVSMDADAITGSSGSCDPFDLVFSGTQTP